MGYWKEAAAWQEVRDAIAACLGNQVNFNSSSRPNGPANGVASACVSMEHPDELKPRQTRVLEQFIIPRLDAFECEECSADVPYSEIPGWFGNGHLCGRCYQRKMKEAAKKV